MENTEREIAQSVYDTLIGNPELEYALPWVEEIFIPGHPCYEAYCRMRQVYLRLCARLGSGEEDSDLEELVDALEESEKYVALEMFRYGKTCERMHNSGEM